MKPKCSPLIYFYKRNVVLYQRLIYTHTYIYVLVMFKCVLFITTSLYKNAMALFCLQLWGLKEGI